MNPKAIFDMLRPERFEPCDFVTNSGDRYAARHPELVVVMSNGTIHLYEPTAEEGAHAENYVRIASIEPLRKQAS